MKTPMKIFLLWIAAMALYAASLVFLQHREVSLPALINRALLTLSFFITLFIVLKDQNKKNRFIFLNFLVFFSLTFFAHLYDFVGRTFLTGSKYSAILYYQYYLATFFLTLSLAIVYLVIDTLFNNFKVVQKYFAAGVIVLFFFVWYFHPILTNPMYMYSTEEMNQWKTLAQHVDKNPGILDAGELAKQVNLQSWRDGKAVGPLYPPENARRIEELLPYVEGNSYLMLLTQPLNANVISMNVMIIGFILLFFGYQYRKDPPQGAYVDKIMFVFLVFVSTEILHYWGYMHSVEWQSFTQLFNVGQYITTMMLFMMVVFFGLRLSFISSVQGEFYEAELAANPQRISRWRDWIDNIVLTRFFNFKPFHGRLFQSIGK